MKRLQKWFALFLALVLSLSSFALTAAADEETSNNPFSGTMNLTVNTTESGQSYTIYQIFQGSMSEKITSASGRLADVQWGLSIKNDAEDNTYDLTSTLIAALQADTLPDGVTVNPVKDLFASLIATGTDGVLQSSAADVARALQNGEERTTAAQQNAFAQIVGDVIRTYENTNNKTVLSYSVQETTDDSSSTTHSFAFTGIKAGYYMVEDTAAVGSNGTSDSRYLLDVSSTSTVADVKTASNPTLTKKIVTTDADGKESLVDYIDAAMGDTITFQLQSFVPNGMEYYNQYYFVIDDTLTEGFTYTANSMTVKLIGSDESNTITLSSAASGSNAQYYTLTTTTTEDGKTALKIVFNDFEQYVLDANYTVQVRYDVTLNSNAVVGSSPNSSAATLTYSSNPDYVYRGTENKPLADEPTGTTAQREVYVYTTAIDVHKLTVEGVLATGTVFRLYGDNLDQVVARQYNFEEAPKDTTETIYYKLNTGVYTTTEPESSTKDSYELKAGVDASAAFSLGNYTKYVYNRVAGTADETVIYDYTDASTIKTDSDGNQYYEITVDENGYLHLEGLKAGTYTLKEVTAPANHDILNAPVTITIAWTEPTAGTTCGWEFSERHGARDEGYVELVSNDDRTALTVTDLLSPIIPSTGGIGTTIFYVAGGILVVGALVLLITRRRMKIMDK
jgi:LPXTG-motif cell wall-anchored protein